MRGFFSSYKSSAWKYESSAWVICLVASGAKTRRSSRKLCAALWAGLWLAVGVSGLACSSAKAQSNQWVWVGGSDSINQAGVYGSLGVPAAGNAPGSRRYAVSWKDLEGNSWLFGGSGYDGAGNQNALNDLWEFNPQIQEWTWMGGDSIVPCRSGSLCSSYFGVYGQLGVAAAGNAPAGRYGATGWTDNNGNLWLFGGNCVDSTGNDGWCNDLWMYNTSSGEWTWMGGSNIATGSCEFGGGNSCAAHGQYGTLGTAAAGNIPTGRMGAVGWKDTSGNLWLFGGSTMVEYGVDSRLNDLWEYTPATNQWAWMGGSIPMCTLGIACDGTPSVFGSLGVAAPGNYPGARWFASSWTDSNGNFWLFGGEGIFASDCGNLNNDLWEYNPLANEWAWMGGSNQCTQNGGPSGTYGTLGTAAAGNTPGGREFASTWVNGDGTLFLMGGTGYDGSGAYGDLNDLWMLNPANAQWSWIGGDDTADQIGIYGIRENGTSGEVVDRDKEQLRVAEMDGQSGTSSPSPGSRDNATGWTDNLGNIWLFGGNGLATSGNSGFLGDLWVYQISQTAPPTFSVASGTYSSAQTVTISDTTAGANIYYTTDGSMPTINAPAYSGPIAVSSSETLQAVARSYGFHTSSSATATYTIQTSQTSQTISFTVPPSTVVYGVSPITLLATSSSGLAVVFSVLSGPATVSGNLLTIVGAGSVVVAANQPGNGSYSAAPEVTQTIGVNQAVPTISWATPAAITYGTALSATQLNATASEPGTFVYTPAAGTVPKVGTQTLSVTFTPSDGTDYSTATGTVSLTVNPATPTISWATPAAITYGTTLSATQLNASLSVPGSCVYTPAAGTVLLAGTQTLSATCTPTDTTDYSTPSASTVSLTINKAALSVTANNQTMSYGGMVPTLTGTLSGVVPGDGISASYATTGTSTSPAGAYPITATLNDPNSKLNNYAVTNTPGTLTIGKIAPTITWTTPAAIVFGTALSSAQLNATASVPGTFVYNPAAGTVPAVGSDTLSVSFTPTDATDYTTATATVTLAVTSPNAVPVISSLSPALAGAGGSAFTLTVTGSGFVSGSTVYWGATALTTTYGSATQLTAQVTSADIVSAGITAITVQTPMPGGGASNALQFEVDSAGSGSTPTFVTLTATVTPGSPATYSVTMPSSATNVSVTCLNLPAGATCTYSSATGAVTIATSSTTPAGNYQITVVFNETLSGAATAFVLLPLLLLPVLFIRRKLAEKGVWLSACVVLALMAGAAYVVGCGGGGGATSTTPPPSTHQATASGVVTLTVQ